MTPSCNRADDGLLLLLMLLNVSGISLLNSSYLGDSSVMLALLDSLERVAMVTRGGTNISQRDTRVSVLWRRCRRFKPVGPGNGRVRDTSEARLALLSN